MKAITPLRRKRLMEVKGKGKVFGRNQLFLVFNFYWFFHPDIGFVKYIFIYKFYYRIFSHRHSIGIKIIHTNQIWILNTGL